MNNVFSLILHSNTFNFAIFLLILIIVCSVFDLGSIITKMRDKVISEINNSKTAKEQSFKDLSEAKVQESKLPKILEDITNNANQKTESLFGQLAIEMEQKIANIESNAQNVIDSEKKNMTSELISKLGLESVEFAKRDIIEELKNNPALHNKFIDESIAKLDEVSL